LPILPLQILYLNIVSDVFPALAPGLSGPGLRGWAVILAMSLIPLAIGQTVKALRDRQSDPGLA